MNRIGNLVAVTPPGDAGGLHPRRPPRTRRLLRLVRGVHAWPHRATSAVTPRTPMRAAACTVVRR
ncbi:hypothetical protein DID96_18245 [Burkholderia sp. Bp8963]|uniref:hypothetical protein n=1 Tax=Burkholderia sp. Bp8963 TaxID=2184547 RepID=UPI000F5A92B5|nr:hypothetical protein [Burkholderia sp. Bp8963]RQS68914.1 hypothetical protein DID96_18245 [Burkholderia sp. Bp8963]